MECCDTFFVTISALVGCLKDFLTRNAEQDAKKFFKTILENKQNGKWSDA